MGENQPSKQTAGCLRNRYYILTADKLQRTAPWLEKLEGGIEHLREVIIDDKLGICEELERRMSFLVDTYECEWKAVGDDPERVKTFEQFVNTKVYTKYNNIAYIVDEVRFDMTPQDTFDCKGQQKAFAEYLREQPEFKGSPAAAVPSDSSEPLAPHPN